MKTCFKCGIAKDRSEFYDHPQMGDGKLGKCKECTRADTRAHSKTPAGRLLAKKAKARRKLFRPLAFKAGALITKAIESGKLVRGSCEVCGTKERVEAHHDDYAFPYAIRWLCFDHHRQWHRHNKPKNGDR